MCCVDSLKHLLPQLGGDDGSILIAYQPLSHMEAEQLGFPNCPLVRGNR